jgi:uncharacterized protein DUF2501
MRRWMAALACVAIPACLVAADGPARAQLLNSLKGAAGMGQTGNGSGMSGGGLGGLGGMSMPQVGSASNGNIAGVLGYCMRNNYLGGSGASSVQQNLMGKLGSGGTSSSQYESGNKGVLQTGNGQNFSLGGSGVKAQLTQKICAQVLNHAKSLI